MKKFFAFLFCAFLLTGVLVGCSKNVEISDKAIDAPRFPYLIINDEPFSVVPADGFDNSGYSTYICDSTDIYDFSAKNSEGIEWSVYLFDEPFEDGARYISQAKEPALVGDGALFIKEGQYVYVYCSANAFTTDEAPVGPVLEITRAEDGVTAKNATYDDYISFLARGIKDKWENILPGDMGLSYVYGYGSENIGYLIKDVNNDGQDELIIGETFDDMPTVIYDMFSPDKDGNISHVICGGERDRFYITKDGIIAEEGSNSAFDSFSKSYELKDGKLVELKLMVDESEYLKLELNNLIK